MLGTLTALCPQWPCWKPQQNHLRRLQLYDCRLFRPFVCYECNTAFQRTCSDLSRDAANINHWACSRSLATVAPAAAQPLTLNNVSANNTRLLNNPGPTTLMWVQGHKGIPGNELADTEAKTVTAAKSDPPKPISYPSARSLNHRTLLDALPTNSHTAKVFGGFKWPQVGLAIILLSVAYDKITAYYTVLYEIHELFHFNHQASTPCTKFK